MDRRREDRLAQSDAALDGAATARRFVLRLYIAGQSRNSCAAQLNLRAFCERELVDRYELEVIDVLRDPRRAAIDGVIATPTLVSASPKRTDSVFGDLRDEMQIRSLLGIDRI